MKLKMMHLDGCEPWGYVAPVVAAGVRRATCVRHIYLILLYHAPLYLIPISHVTPDSVIPKSVIPFPCQSMKKQPIDIPVLL